MSSLDIDIQDLHHDSLLGLNFTNEYEEDDGFVCIGSTYDNCGEQYDTDIYVYAEDEGLYVRVRMGDEEWEKFDFLYRGNGYGDHWTSETSYPLSFAHNIINQYHLTFLGR